MKLKPALGVVLVFVGGAFVGGLWGIWEERRDSAEVLCNARAAAKNELALLERELGRKKIRNANAAAELQRLKQQLRRERGWESRPAARETPD
ncbi:hypothetical protein [Verrucomicrobium spinosum]|uniref:hypothetical protein n=1 Tax=Verrucomicrobium spinosum TaxID=2736 RepID=UPI0001745617|nr:hypothetical protein [Verrucomicrobium spinosum]